MFNELSATSAAKYTIAAAVWPLHADDHDDDQDCVCMEWPHAVSCNYSMLFGKGYATGEWVLAITLPLVL